MLRSFWTVLAIGFTLAAIGLSMAMNFAFGYGLGTSPFNARILASLSVVCDGLKALLPLFIAWQWADGHRLAALAATLLFALLLAYGAASAIGFAAENRTAFTLQRDNRNTALDSVTADLAAAEARRAALPSHRLRGVIGAELAALRQDRSWDATRGCTEATLPASRAFCKDIERLRGELAIAEEEFALSGEIDRLKDATKEARDAGGGHDADPQAHAIAQFTGLKPDSIRAGLTWLLALAVEAVSAFGLFAISRRSSARPSAAGRPAGPWRLANRHHDIAPTENWRLTQAG